MKRFSALLIAGLLTAPMAALAGCADDRGPAKDGNVHDTRADLTCDTNGQWVSCVELTLPDGRVLECVRFGVGEGLKGSLDCNWAEPVREGRAG